MYLCVGVEMVWWLQQEQTRHNMCVREKDRDTHRVYACCVDMVR